MNLLALHPNVRLRIAVLFVQRLIDTMIATFIAIYLASRVGAALTGALILLLAVLAMGAMLLGGHLSESRGRRPVLVLGEAAAFVFFAVMALAEYAGGSPLLVFAGYMLVKFGTSLAMPASDSMIVDVTEPADRKTVFTISYWAMNLALAGGAMLGGFLYGTHFELLIAVGAVGMGGTLLVTVLFISETRPEPPAPEAALEPSTAEPGAAAGPGGEEPSGQGHRGRSGITDGYRLVLADRTFGRLLLAATLGMTLELQMNNFVGVRLATELPVQHLFPFGDVDGPQVLGLLKAQNTLLVVVLALFLPVLLHRVPDRVRLYAGLALFAGGFAVLAVSNTVWVLLLACLVLTVGELLNVPVKQALLAELAPEQGRSRYLAVYNLSIRIAQSLAALFITLGAIVSSWGIAALYLLMGLVAIVQYRAILADLPRRQAASRPVPTPA